MITQKSIIALALAILRHKQLALMNLHPVKPQTKLNKLVLNPRVSLRVIFKCVLHCALKGPLSATPLFLFTCKNLANIFYLEHVTMKEITVKVQIRQFNIL